jgi:hypothetical protein
MNRWSEWGALVSHPAVIVAVIGTVAQSVVSVGAPWAWVIWAAKVIAQATPGLLALKIIQDSGSKTQNGNGRDPSTSSG